MYEIDLSAGTAPPSADVELIAVRDGAIDGVVLSWEADLAPGITIATHPGSVSDGAHWRVRLVPIVPRVEVRAGQRVRVSLAPGPSVRVAVAGTPGTDRHP